MKRRQAIFFQKEIREKRRVNDQVEATVLLTLNGPLLIRLRAKTDDALGKKLRSLEFYPSLKLEFVDEGRTP